MLREAKIRIHAMYIFIKHTTVCTLKKPHSINNMFPRTKKKGDLVTHVDGEAISGMSASEVSEAKEVRGRVQAVGVWGWMWGCYRVGDDSFFCFDHLSG